MRASRLVLAAMLTIGLLAAPRFGDAQGPGSLPRIGIVFSDSPVTSMLGNDPLLPTMRAFLQGLRALGMRTGRTS